MSNYIDYQVLYEITYLFIRKLQQCNDWSLGMDN